jgi:uncharacterized protein (DUF1684 family)
MNTIILRPLMALLVCLAFFTTYSQPDQEATAEINEHRKKQQQEMRDPKESPLSKKDRRRFKGLNYYAIDLSYRVKAKFIKTENPVLFKMKTTTTRLPEYSKFGEVHFDLNGQHYKLEVYHNSEIAKRPGYEDYLFIPFTDETNGKETYEVGRYLDFRSPAGEEVTIDFNLAYNPYCSYSPNFSCPIPPEVNYLRMQVKAGEMNFRSDH